MKTPVAVLALLSAGCAGTSISGGTTATPAGSSSGASSAGSSTGGGTMGPGTTGTTGGTAGTSAASSTGTGTGTGTSSGGGTSGTTTGACVTTEAVCSSSAECCGGEVCGENLTADDGGVSDAGLACCADTGASCDGGQDGCCGMCMDGQCACVPVTNECTNNAGCCAGEACMIRASGGNVDSPLACCQMLGSFCVPNVQCCSGLCVNLTCICVPDGGLCGEAPLYAAAGPAACCSGICSDAGFCL